MAFNRSCTEVVMGQVDDKEHCSLHSMCGDPITHQIRVSGEVSMICTSRHPPPRCRPSLTTNFDTKCGVTFFKYYEFHNPGKVREVDQNYYLDPLDDLRHVIIYQTPRGWTAAPRSCMTYHRSYSSNGYTIPAIYDAYKKRSGEVCVRRPFMDESNCDTEFFPNVQGVFLSLRIYLGYYTGPGGPPPEHYTAGELRGLEFPRVGPHVYDLYTRFGRPSVYCSSTPSPYPYSIYSCTPDDFELSCLEEVDDYEYFGDYIVSIIYSIFKPVFRFILRCLLTLSHEIAKFLVAIIVDIMSYTLHFILLRYSIIYFLGYLILNLILSIKIRTLPLVILNIIALGVYIYNNEPEIPI